MPGKAKILAILEAAGPGKVLSHSGGALVGADAGGGGPHATSHQNGGADEVSVAGLSGVLADAQTPAAHSHAEADVTGLVSDLAGKEAAGTAAAAVTAHEAAADPHAGYQREVEKAAANGYASLGADGKVPAGQLPASGGGWATARKDADQTGIGTTATDVSGLSVAVASGQRLRFRARLLVRSSATTIGAMTSVNGPAASPVSFRVREWTSATVQVISMLAALNAFAVRTAGPGATTVLYEIEGFVKFSAAGTFIVQAKAETGGTMSVLEGSWLEYDLQ